VEMLILFGVIAGCFLVGAAPGMVRAGSLPVRATALATILVLSILAERWMSDERHAYRFFLLLPLWAGMGWGAVTLLREVRRPR